MNQPISRLPRATARLNFALDLLCAVASWRDHYSFKVFQITSVLLYIVLAFGIVRAAEPFDETAWRRTVESQSVEKLYAPHFKDGKYFNPWLPMDEKKFWRFLKWRFSQKAPYTEAEKSFRADVIPGLADRIAALPAEDFIAWIGHATFLIRLQGEYWLTDPMFSERALLPKRISPPAMPVEDLKKLNGRLNVLISHSHYDHLDVDSLQALPEGTRVFVPPGLKAFVSSFFPGEIRELDWWGNIDLEGGVKLVSLPAQHWSRRIGQSVNSTLWASFLLITPDVKVYYGGDSGYFIGYREIGRRFPGIDYALMPVTAYDPRWFMHYSHVDAPEALQAFADLGARVFIPTQWGTFPLGDNPPGKPALDLMKLRQSRNLDPARYPILAIGQIEILKSRP
jgi:N-acyl-phosphatidylethanolamine-hydrolysing phospholipase D